MNDYRAYMDRQQVSGKLHETLLAMEPPKRVHWQRYAALAACAAVIVGLGVWRLWPEKPDYSDYSRVEQKCAFPALSYPEDNSAVQSSLDIALPDGAIFQELTPEELGGILGETLSETLSRYSLTGSAIYDGAGALWEAQLWGEAENGDDFYLELAPGNIPPTCVVFMGGEKTDVYGVEVTDWGQYYDSNGDGVKEHHYNSAFLAHDVGIRARFESVEECVDSNYFIYEATGNGLTLSHIAQLENVPAFRSAWLKDYSEALQESDFLPYLPASVPEGFEDFGGKRVYQEGIDNHLVVYWHRGQDDLHLYITLPEGAASAAYTPVDIGAPETWDLRQYDWNRWDEDLPFALLDTLEFPTFRAEDMSRDVIEARQDGRSYQFEVLHPNGAAVEYSISGLTVDEVWAMVEATL